MKIVLNIPDILRILAIFSLKFPKIWTPDIFIEINIYFLDIWPLVWEKDAFETFTCDFILVTWWVASVLITFTKSTYVVKIDDKLYFPKMCSLREINEFFLY